MADNFDMKKFLVENQTGPYAKAKLAEGEAAYEYEKGKEAGEKEEKEKLKKEDIGGDIGDAEAEKMMDFLAEYEVIYVYGEDGKCYRKDDEGNYDQVDRSYCQRYAGSGVREEKEKVEETVDKNTLNKVEQVLDMISNLKSNTSTNSNIPRTDKQGLVYAFQEMEDILEDVAADIEQEDEYVSDYSKRRAQELDEAMDAKSFGGILKSDNPEGDALVLRFLQGIAKKFEYPVSHAAMFVKERIKKLGY
jgi:hypothetical protein